MKNKLTVPKADSDKVNSRQHKMLRKYYGWDGEGKYRALCDMMAESDGCILMLHDKPTLNIVASELDFTTAQLQEFVCFLDDAVQLICRQDDGFTTKALQLSLTKANKKRTYDRLRKQKAAAAQTEMIVSSNGILVENELSTVEKAIVDADFAKMAVDFEQIAVDFEHIKLNKTKLNKIKHDELKEKNTNATRPENTGRSFFSKKQLTANTATRIGLPNQLIDPELRAYLAEKHKHGPG